MPKDYADGFDVEFEGIRPFLSVLKNADDEQGFRQESLAKHRRLVFNLCSILAIAIPIFMLSDNMIVKQGAWESFLVGQRLMQIATCIIFLFLMSKIESPKAYDALVFSAIFIFLILLEVGSFTFLDDYILYALFDLIVIISLYASGVLPLKLSLILCLYHSMVAICIILFIKDISVHNQIMLVLAYSLSNGAGILLAIAHHRAVRQEYFLKSSLRDRSIQLKQLAYRDSLTNALNRRAFQEHFPDFKKMVERIQCDEGELYLIAADIDHFKSINDTYGHDVGDKVLVAFTKMLESQVRPQDNVYRFGGEEFTILFIGCLKETVIQRIEQIMDILNNKGLGVEEINRPVTCSFGMTQVVTSDSVDSVCIRADEALYQAKNNGRNQYIYKSAEE